MVVSKTNILFSQKKKNLALVLSGGSARGLAHIGVLEVLEENKIPIDVIVGTSMGSVIGGIYACGKLKEFKEEIVRISHSKMKALFWTIKLRKMNSDPERSVGPFLKKFIGDKKIEDLGINYTAIATDLDTGKEVYLNKGSLLKAICASICLPGIFHPVVIGHRHLIDGGIVDPLPQGYAHLMARKVIAVNAMPKKVTYRKKNEGIFEVLSMAEGIMTNTLINLENVITLKDFQNDKFIYIQLKTDNRKPFDFYNISELIDIGRKAAKKDIKRIIELARN